ncbi:inorganic phosphate transporter [Muriicola marianensis]|uniref:Phosphate transporter n=1 Tax=Muriicola marianensis TaxID=1324801 RepID=A0ABQ1QVQ3_9FLAO|nr:inorganic phosphate transporter [Muriicola marianensis]GGD48611.1 phosphate transporter [Muriicola marianensis]
MAENFYLFMIIALAALAITDLVVGVSNDAVNFLNSAIGSKAISFRTIMIVASIGIAMGAISSSGMMEVARKGIFNPGEFVFDEIMIIFMAVMITDILLLDFFNTLGMPTSTTVSIVFELLGASVAISTVKILNLDGEFTDLWTYINTEKATEIILGIILSVIIAFTIGAIIQFLTRIFLTFSFDKKPVWVGSAFGSVGITSIIYFIIVKGLKSTALLSDTVNEFIALNTGLFILINLIVWFAVSWMTMQVFRQNIYRLIIILGTFALAMAFAGNDLVNFIGVPIAAYQAFLDWNSSGVSALEYNMANLSAAVQTPTLLLFLSGVVMIITLWFSTKARNVVKTSVDLSRQDEGEERFQPNYLSRVVVKYSIKSFENVSGILPRSLKRSIDAQFQKEPVFLPKSKVKDLPAFDMVRASVNLMVASVLISLATSMKLPLSTTYVTFMVAMGTSLADKAWGSESAVYRVAGVLNVIGGWFLTAITAFVASGIVAYLIYLGGFTAVVILLLLSGIILVRNYLNHRKKSLEEKMEYGLRRAESSSIQGVILESAGNISNVVKRCNKIYTNSINGLSRQDLDVLKKNRKQVNKLSAEIDDLRDNIFYFIKNLDEGSEGATKFYLDTLDYLQDMAQSLEYIIKISYKHVNNNHKKLKYSQIRELQEIDEELETLLEKTRNAFDKKNFEEIGAVLAHKDELLEMVSEKISRQIARTRTEESSPKNTTLYFNLLTETKDLITATMNLLEMYYSDYDSNVEPAAVEEN